MSKLAKINTLLLCLGLFLAGCGGNGESLEEGTIPVESSDPGGLTQAAVEKQKIGAFEEAVEILNRALAMDANFGPAHYRMGAVYEEWDKRREAAAAYKKALAIDPANVEARLGLGSVYSKLSRNNLAVEEYKKVAEARPDDPEIPFKIALEYWFIQKLPETAEHYLKVIEIDPDHMQAHLNLASVYERMKEWDKAVEQIDIALRMGKEKGNVQAISIAESKLAFIKGRMNMSEKEMDRKTQPPFE
ncbi:MAG: tetratricopeptide repeat protein [Nitrospinaceae bacterium]